MSVNPRDLLILRRCQLANVSGIYPSKSRLAEPLGVGPNFDRWYRAEVDRLAADELIGHLRFTHPVRDVIPLSHARPFAGGARTDGTGGRRWRLAVTDKGRQTLAQLHPDELADLDRFLPDNKIHRMNRLGPKDSV